MLLRQEAAGLNDRDIFILQRRPFDYEDIFYWWTVLHTCYIRTCETGFSQVEHQLLFSSLALACCLADLFVFGLEEQKHIFRAVNSHFWPVEGVFIEKVPQCAFN